MKLLSILATVRESGNSALASRYIAQELDASLEILRLTDLDIEPCKACYACLFGEDCKIDDDVDRVYDRIGETDMVLIASPIYWLDATGSFKALLDRQFMAVPHLEEFSGKKSAIITSHGFKNLRGWASSTHLVFARSLQLNVLANMEINAGLPGEILTERENIEKLDKIVEAFKNGEKVRSENQCPVCLNTTFRVESGIRCPVCGSELDDDLNLVEKGERLERDWVNEHFFTRLVEMKEDYGDKIDEIKKSVDEILNN
ncbi:NADPH-dependent FMN reductase [candidate division MSBL1 archaeon SCGC-AAA259J03]|uniref:NADPH-dependent FMN reductase n=1 Tax=candidate division MSBL1 archaeon SCGC-AAA259J03 TaxID=1698269 RepID=A0A656YV83_9EURY|nr:NADPH-dependent FMN reductase [candidate division MSBL1 archaeon SCGC-AAA259J03]